MGHKCELSVEQLRWICNADDFAFETTENIPAEGHIVGQEVAMKALGYGLMTRAEGQNIYVRGLPGTGRMTAVVKMLEELAPQMLESEHVDMCFVHNFSQVDKPRLLELPAGKSKDFKRSMRLFVEFIREELPSILDSEESQAEQQHLQDQLQVQLAEISEPFNQELAEKKMTLLSVQGTAGQQIIVPLIDGQAISPPEYQTMVQQGAIDADMQKHFKDTHAYFVSALKKLNREAFALNQTYNDEIFKHGESLVRLALEGFVQVIHSKFPTESVEAFLNEVLEDVVELVLAGKLHEQDLDVRYGVNVVLEQSEDLKAPVVIENVPSMFNLMGSVEPFWEGSTPKSDYRGVRGGSILKAHGGFLILDVQELLMEPGAWRSLIRTLKTGFLEIVPKELGMYMPHMVVKPEPIDVRVRIVLLGDANMYYRLRALDPDFMEKFKVLADFDFEMENNPQALEQYARVVSFVVEKENLCDFTACAVAKLCEYGARQAGHRERLSTRFGRISDLVRESAFVAWQEESPQVNRSHVSSAIQHMRERNMLPSRKFKEQINRGTIIIETRGDVVGQINGLAVMSSGDIMFGFPARITATIGSGRSGIIDIEGMASMSGSIHTKGVNILAGLLRHLLRLDHPFAFSASLAFEQSYGGIDGDSASGAETCCLLSALTEVPLKQSLSMTGAIDQHGRIQAIGGVNEKIEGFFDICVYQGLTGDQGVIIPKSNEDALMLREDVIEAVNNGQFHIYAIENIYQALELLTGMDVGEMDGEGEYLDGTLLAMAKRKITEYWVETLKSPSQVEEEHL